NPMATPLERPVLAKTFEPERTLTLFMRSKVGSARRTGFSETAKLAPAVSPKLLSAPPARRPHAISFWLRVRMQVCTPTKSPYESTARTRGPRSRAHQAPPARERPDGWRSARRVARAKAGARERRVRSALRSIVQRRVRRPTASLPADAPDR